MRVLGLAPDGAFAVLKTDGRTIDAFGPAGQGEPPLEGVELIGLAAGDAEALARQTGLPVAHGLGEPLLKAVYYRARVRALGLERPAAVVDGERVVLIAANGLLRARGDPARARTVVSAEELGAEAEAIAYLAARCWNGLPVAFPSTTGAPYPMPVGQIARPQ